MTILGYFESKRLGHQIQPSELSILADLAILFYVVKGRWPTKAELKALWDEVYP